MPTITFAHLDSTMRIVCEPVQPETPVAQDDREVSAGRDVRQVEPLDERGRPGPGRTSARTEGR